MQRRPIAGRHKGGARYHHGDLRAALILTAREALRTEPPEAIQLKALAVRIGVSQPAPYKHFDGRDALLVAVAADGFDRLQMVLATAERDGAAQTPLAHLCQAYVDFGLDNLGVYRLMFSRKILASSDGRLAAAADASFELMARHVASQVSSDRATTAAVSIWATLHGVVMLEADDLLSGPRKRGVTATDVVGEILARFHDTPAC